MPNELLDLPVPNFEDRPEVLEVVFTPPATLPVRRHAIQSFPGIAAAYALLGVVAVSAVFAFVVGMASTTRVVHTYSDKQVNTMSGLRGTLGKPIAVLDGASLGLPAGTACYGYSKKDGVYILCPAR